MRSVASQSREPGRDRRRAVAREDRREDRLEPAQRERPRSRSRAASAGRSRPGRPAPTPWAANIRRRPFDLGRELAVRQPPDRRRPRPPRRLRSPSGSRAARGSVAAIAWLNAPPLHHVAHSGPSRDVHRGGRSALPVEPEVVGGGAPEPGRIVDRAGLERLEVLGARRAEEAGQPSVSEEFGRSGARRHRGRPARRSAVARSSSSEPTPAPAPPQRGRIRRSVASRTGLLSAAGPSAGLRGRTNRKHSRTCSIDTGPTRNERPAHRPATTATPSRCWIAPRPDRSTRQRCVPASPPRRPSGFATASGVPRSRPAASPPEPGASRERAHRRPAARRIVRP